MRARSLTDAGVVCLMHAGVAISLIAPETDAPTRLPGGARRFDLPSGAEHAPRIR
jgi:hypothetical protein